MSMSYAPYATATQPITLGAYHHHSAGAMPVYTHLPPQPHSGSSAQPAVPYYAALNASMFPATVMAPLPPSHAAAMASNHVMQPMDVSRATPHVFHPNSVPMSFYIPAQQQQAVPHYQQHVPSFLPTMSTPVADQHLMPPSPQAYLATCDDTSSASTSTSASPYPAATISVGGVLLNPLPVPVATTSALNAPSQSLPREPHEVRFSSSAQKRNSRPVEVPPPAPGETECLELVVRYLAPEITDVGLTQLYSRYAGFVQARVATELGTGRSRGFGYVWFTSQAAAAAAMDESNGRVLLGKRVRVLYAVPQTRAPQQTKDAVAA